jgi:hypothetical protein
MGHRARDGGHARALPTLRTHALQTDLLAAQAQIPCTIRGKSTRRQFTSDFQKLRQALRAKIFRFRICPNQPHNSARLTR